MTQRELALRLNVTTQTVSNWEAARNEPTARQLVALARLFDIACEQIALPFDTKTTPPPQEVDQ
jgi:transcriptional regulator with XRE-family HTH domain